METQIRTEKYASHRLATLTGLYNKHVKSCWYSDLTSLESCNGGNSDCSDEVCEDSYNRSDAVKHVLWSWGCVKRTSSLSTLYTMKGASIQAII